MSLCDFNDRLTIYIGHGNVVSVVPIANAKTGAKLDMEFADRVDVCVGGAIGKSNDNPAYVWWDQNDDDDWVIHFKPGMFTDIPSGEQYAAIIVYSDTYPNGLVLTHTYPLNIVELC
jgi:hypothetical protein